MTAHRHTPHTPPPPLFPVDEPSRPAEAWDRAVQALAEVRGAAVIVCPLHDLPVTGPLTVNGEISRKRIQGGSLTGMVEEPSGAATLHRDLPVPEPEPERVPPGLSYGEELRHYWAWKEEQDHIREKVEYERRIPVGVLRWWDAWPGEPGACVLEPVRNISIRGFVSEPDGSPAAGASVRGCIDHVTADDHGGFELQGVAGVRCSIWVSVLEAKLRGSTTVTPTGTGDVEGVLIELGASETGLRQIRADAIASTEAGVLDMIDDLSQAEHLPDLDAEVLHLLGQWRQELEAGVATMRERQEQMEAMEDQLERMKRERAERP